MYTYIDLGTVTPVELGSASKTHLKNFGSTSKIQMKNLGSTPKTHLKDFGFEIKQKSWVSQLS